MSTEDLETVSMEKRNYLQNDDVVALITAENTPLNMKQFFALNKYGAELLRKEWVRKALIGEPAQSLAPVGARPLDTGRCSLPRTR